MKIHFTEKFLSVQGEGHYVGAPSVFLRTFGCNFRCKLFGRAKTDSTEGNNPEVQTIIDNIDQYKKFEDLPLARTGCDTYASIYPEFKRFAQKEESTRIAEQLRDLLPTKAFSGQPASFYHLVITGGEPLLGWQRAYVDLLESLPDLKHLTFETNGTQMLQDQLIEFLNTNRPDLEVTFSVSPKLSASGETWENAIKPDVLASYRRVNNRILYTKFVVGGEEDFEEVDRAIAELGYNNGVYIMPVGGCLEEYQASSLPVADACLKRGYRFTPRLHINLYGNVWGS